MILRTHCTEIDDGGYLNAVCMLVNSGPGSKTFLLAEFMELLTDVQM